MNVEWPGDRCVFCLDQAPLTSEHIIPSSLGGILTCTFLCRACNSDLGAYLEALAKTDPSIRLAIGHLHTQIPELARKLTEGQAFISHGPGGKSQGTIKNGRFRTRACTKADGWLTLPNEHARHSIARMLHKSDVGAPPIEEALKRFEEAPENERITIGYGIEAVKWTIERIEPDLSKCVLLSPLVPLKIAYEFLACHLGTAVYDEANQMAELRMVLRERMEKHPCFSVERLTSSEYKPFHGIVFEGNDPYARVLIRLFGWLAFRVHLRHLVVKGHQFIYTHMLDSKKEDIRIVNHEKVAP